MTTKNKILLSAFACDPKEGSEKGNGWNWAVGLSGEGYEVHCMTRVVAKKNILELAATSNITFHFIKLPFGLEKLYAKSQATMYLYYLLWQFKAYINAKKLCKTINFKLVHHVTWGSVQLGSFMYKLPIPFIFGPAGGGQTAPEAFKKYFTTGWVAEERRNKVSVFLLKFNPAAKKMYAVARAIWVSNPDTAQLIKINGGKKVMSTLDAALPDTFFPASFIPKKNNTNELKLLWVGRFMPRKGILLVLDVMNTLKHINGITLTVVGDGEQKEVFLGMIEKLGLGRTVFWKGSVPFEKVKEYYNTHEAFFFTSLRDSCPAQLIEAMAYGLPIITINLHGQSFIVNDDTGFRCKCDTSEQAITELHKSILELYNNPALLTQMSIAAHKFALQQSWSKKIKTIINECYNF